VETTALGAAVGAGLAVGVYSREFLTELHAHAETGFKPRTEPGVRQAKAKGWAKAVRKSFGWADGQAV
jgi:glycerol kinase